MSHVFVSYDHDDKRTVEALVKSLREREREVWVDEDRLHPASKFMEVIVPAIHSCQAFLFIFSSNSAVSSYCLEELACARESGTKIIPIWLEDPKSVERTARIPAEIHGVTGIPWNPQRSAGVIDRLLKAIDIDADWHEARKRLLTAAEQWEKQPERGDLFLRGKAITDALEVVATARSRKIQLLRVELEYLTKSQAQEAADLARERELRQKAVARQLAADAERILQTQPDSLDLAVLLALESWRRFPKLQASHVLRTGLYLLPLPLASLRHAGPVRDCCFNADGTMAATGSDDGTAKVWDIVTGRELWSLDHGATVTRVAFQGSHCLVTVGGDETLRVSKIGTREDRRFKVEPRTTIITGNGRYAGWGTGGGSAYVLDLAEGGEPMLLKHDNRVAEVAVSSDGKWAAIYTESPLLPGKPTTRKLRLWNLPAQSHRDLDLNSKPLDIEFSPTARFLIADAGGGARVWEVASGRELYSVQGRRPTISRDEKAIAYIGNRSASASGGLIASGCVLAIARATDGEPVRYLNEEQQIRAVDFFRGHDYIAAGTGRMVRVWESDTGREMSRILHSGTVHHVAYSHAGRLMSVTDEGAVYFWRLRVDPIREMDNVDGSVTGIAAAPNGRYLALIVGPEFVVFDCDAGEAIHRQQRAGRLHSIDIADDGCFLFLSEPTTRVSASGREEVGASGFVIGSPGQAETWVPLNRISTAAISPTGEFLAVEGDSEVQLWNVRARTRCSGWDVSDAVKKLIFSPCGRYLAIVSAEHLWIANVFVQVGAPRPLKTPGSIVDVAYGTDGHCFVLHERGGVSVWDPDNNESIDGFESGEPVARLFPGPKSDQVVLAGSDRCVTWALQTKKVGFKVRHEGLLAISGDRKRIAVLQEQGRETWICNLVEEEVEARLCCHRTRFTGAAFIWNERVAVTDDGGMCIEPICGADLEEDLSNRVGRQLTANEWERYLPDELSKRHQM